MRVLILFLACCALSEAFLFKWFGKQGSDANNPDDSVVVDAAPTTPLQQLYFQVPESFYYLNNDAGQSVNFLNIVEPRHPVIQHPIPGASFAGAPVIVPPVSRTDSYVAGPSVFESPTAAIKIVGSSSVGSPQVGLPFYAQFENNAPLNEQPTFQAPYPFPLFLQSSANPLNAGGVQFSSVTGNQALQTPFLNGQVVADHLSTSGQHLQQVNLVGNGGSFNVQQTIPATYHYTSNLQSPVIPSVTGGVHVSSVLANHASPNPILNGQVVADHLSSSQNLQQNTAGNSDFPANLQFASQEHTGNVEQEQEVSTTKPFEFPANQQPPYTSPANFNGVSLVQPIPLPSLNIDNSFASLPSSYGPPALPVVQQDPVSQHSYSLGDGTKVSEQTSFVTSSDGVNKELVKNGEYEYIGENGSLTKVKWVADDNGFRVLP